MEAAHFARNTSSEGYDFEGIEGYGRSLSRFEMFPKTERNSPLFGSFTRGQFLVTAVAWSTSPHRSGRRSNSLVYENVVVRMPAGR